jgi:MtrB/PioB family decaheme-associated outer membrane protein
MTMHTRSFKLTAVAAALCSAFGAAQAADDDITKLTKPDSTVQFGLGYVDSDSRRFGQYNGLKDDGVYGLLDADIVRRDDTTGTWVKLRARNLGLQSRELRVDHERQGSWSYYVDYTKIPRYEPYQALTGVTGIGSNNLAIPSPAAATGLVDLKVVRERVGLGYNKHLMGNWSFKIDFRNETKDGARLWARGTTGDAGNFEFAPEPINSTTRQLDAVVGYTGERLQLSGGYYGTTYNNQYTGLNFTGGAGGLSSFTPIGLPPDSHSHQLHLSGAYAFTPTTHGNFKIAYGKAQQDDAFVTGVPLAPGIGNSLQGRIDTTLVQMGLTARPLPKLTLRGNLRYNDRDDKTPILMYGTAGTTTDGNNEPRSIRTTNGKVEASYALPMAFRVTGGIDYEEKKRNTSPIRVVSFRDTTEETAYRVELRRSVSDTITGALGYTHSDRTGSPFLLTERGGSTLGSNLIAPIHLADRKRDKVRLSASWQVAEPLSLQFLINEASDRYDGDRDGSGLGMRKGRARVYSIDATYAISEKWQANAFAMRSRNKINQSTCESASNAGVCSNSTGNPIWRSALSNVTDSFGLGTRGKPFNWLEIGGDLSFSDIKDEYRQEVISPASASIDLIPDVTTRLTRVKLFAKYAIQKNSGLRFDYIYDRFSTNDWTWSTWTYTDGTKLTQNPNQKAHFIGLSYYYRWQ